MERDERYEVNSQGAIVVGTPVTLTPTEKKNMIEKMFTINGWTYTLIEEITSAHYYIELKNENLQVEKRFHLYHGNVRKEDPDRNREEKKIQLGTDNDPRQYFDDALILGFYVYENKDSLNDTVIVAWPIEEGKNYTANPSLRVNMRTDIMPAKNAGYYVDKTTGKNLVVFRPEFIYHYIDNYKDLHYGVLNNIEDSDDETNTNEVAIDKFDFSTSSINEGQNLIVYGTPGCGKSYYVEHTLLKDYPAENYVRTTFFQDYTNTDFVGQILPVVDGEKVTYKFNPGPFTLALEQAIEKPNEKVALVIEELNRGSAASIFGDIFQLLDRKNGVSEYSINNVNIINYLKEKFEGKYTFDSIKLPGNLSIYATMNTSDQNVFTLDTAFKRRWKFKKLLNKFENDHKFKDKYIPGANITWKNFVDGINKYILESSSGLNSEDKQLGVYFVDDNGMRDSSSDTSESQAIEDFAYKVLEYLWADVAKFDRPGWFDKEIKSLDDLVAEYKKRGLEVFADEVFNK